MQQNSKTRAGSFVFKPIMWLYALLPLYALLG